MALTLVTYPGNFRAFKALIAAEYAGVEIAVKDVDAKAAAKLSPTGKVPVLETPQGTIFESNAIARYVARMRRDTELYGATFFESGQVSVVTKPPSKILKVYDVEYTIQPQPRLSND